MTTVPPVLWSLTPTPLTTKGILSQVREILVVKLVLWLFLVHLGIVSSGTYSGVRGTIFHVNNDW